MKTRRILMSLAGVLICAVSVGVFKIAALGVDPFQSLIIGLDNCLPIPFCTQFTYETLQIWLPDPSLPVRVLCLLIGIVVICFGSALYMTANLGVSTYDAVAIVLSYKWKWGQFQYVRICCDLVCVLLGVGIFLLSGGTLAQVPTIAGIGTIITAFFMGPLIQFFNIHVAEPMLKK